MRESACSRCGYDVRADRLRCPECGSDVMAQVVHYRNEHEKHPRGGTP